MTREEVIKKAAEQFADREHGAMRDVSVFNLLQYAFKCGAEWADDNYLAQVWHPATEEPQGDEWEVLCEADGCYLTTDPLTLAWKVGQYWEKYVRVNSVKRWLYISDLLPKGNVPSTK